ncbi:hypothetical protein C6341_g24140 [Phytophthora cactorum]|nr:hypothetical protein C6341_g24140 [Phytophthora cactorum]
MKYFDIAMISMMVYRKERESVCGLSRSVKVVSFIWKRQYVVWRDPA